MVKGLRVRERAGLVPEQFRFEKGVRDCGAVERHERPTGRAEVDLARDAFLSDAALPGDQDGRFRLRGRADRPPHVFRRRADA